MFKFYQIFARLQLNSQTTSMSKVCTSLIALWHTQTIAN